MLPHVTVTVWNAARKLEKYILSEIYKTLKIWFVLEQSRINAISRTQRNLHVWKTVDGGELEKNQKTPEPHTSLLLPLAFPNELLDEYCKSNF